MAVTYLGATERARQVVHHHAVLRRGLERRAGALREAAENGSPFQRQLRALQEYVAGEILPHAQAEERTLYPAALTRARGSELIRTLTAEHRELARLAGRLQPGADSTEAATVSQQIATLFAGHVAKENDLLLVRRGRQRRLRRADPGPEGAPGASGSSATGADHPRRSAGVRRAAPGV